MSSGDGVGHKTNSRSPMLKKGPMLDKEKDIKKEFPLEVWLGPDPELALVEVDMHSWQEAHPCSCNDLCTCD